jgi:membrane-bound lytic murein transglycosylase B
MIGRGVRLKLGEWVRMGVMTQDGMALPGGDIPASLIQPGAPNDADLYLVAASQFASLRAYNPSDKYALCIGLLADRIGA